MIDFDKAIRTHGGRYRASTGEFDPGLGCVIDNACERMQALSAEVGKNVWMEFNGHRVTANPGGSAKALVSYWRQASEAASQRYQKSPEYAARQAEWREADRLQQIKRDEWRANPPTLAIIPAMAEQYAAYVGTNSSDGYSRGVVDYAERWACLMERAMQAGSSIADCAESTSHEADVDGITGFMYGCAVQALSQFWIHGPELRRWHNSKYLSADEVEAAQESGGTVNPAILTIGGR